MQQINSSKEKITDHDEVGKLLGKEPNCFSLMKGRIREYEPGKSLTVSFVVQEEYLNPALSMQGGFITGAFDNVFGPLCQLATGTMTATAIDINTSYHRPVFSGEEFTVCAKVKNLGRTKIHMLADAFDAKGKLIATATSTYLQLKKQ